MLLFVLLMHSKYRSFIKSIDVGTAVVKMYLDLSYYPLRVGRLCLHCTLLYVYMLIVDLCATIALF